MAELSKYKLVWECKSETTFGFTVEKLNLDFLCEMCGNNITLCMSWEDSEKFELQSTCYCDQTLKIDAKKVSNIEDNTVAVLAVVGKFKIKKKELWGKHIGWLAVHEDGSSFSFTTDDNGSWMIKGKEKKMEPKDSGKKLKGKRKMEPKLKRKHTPMKVKRSRGESDRAYDDYDISKYNREERDDYESPEEVDYEDTYDPPEFLISTGAYDKDGYPPEFEREKVVKKSKGDEDKKKSKDDGSGVGVKKEGTEVVDLRVVIHPL